MDNSKPRATDFAVEREDCCWYLRGTNDRGWDALRVSGLFLRGDKGAPFSEAADAARDWIKRNT